MKNIVIVGGGLSGLAAGEILSKHFKTTILESAPYLGGLASTFEHEGKNIPFYYHHIIKSNKTTQKYLFDFGNVKKLSWKKIKIAIGVKKRLYNINEIIGLLSFDHLSFYEKVRFGIFGIYTITLMNPNKIKEGVSAKSWLEKFAGKGVTEKIFYHLYSRNKFNIPLNKISAKQFANRLYEKEVYDFFSFPKNSYQEMIDSLKNKIKDRGGEIILSSKIEQIDLKKKKIICGKSTIKYDFMINSIPLPEFIKLSTGLPPDFKVRLSKVKYCPAVGLVFATETLLDKKNYWINFFNERIHILMQHSILCDVYNDKINWCLRYGGSEEDYNLSDEEIKTAYLKVIKDYFPNSEIKWAKVMKTKYAEPIYDIDYHKYAPNYQTPIEGLYFTGIQLTYPKIRNMNVALESGIKVAKTILQDQKKLLI